MDKKLKIIFAGTPDFAVQHLHTLIQAKYSIVGVLTQPDRPAGRGNKLTSSPVKTLALKYHLPVFQPKTLRKMESQHIIAELKADLMIVVAYGLLLPQAVLNLFRLGCINVHGSLLPRWRGAAPIQRALWAGDNVTGVTIMQMDANLDTGDILHKLSCEITSADTSASLYQKLALLGPEALITVIEQIQKKQATVEKQDSTLATYAKKLSKEEAKLNWSLSASQLERCVRAFNPWPISHFYYQQQMIKVWQSEVIKYSQLAQPGLIIKTDKSGILVSAGQDALLITQIQLAGRKTMPVSDVLNSRQDWFKAGTVLD